MSFSAAASSLAYSQTVMDVVAHNLANISTNGFKKIVAKASGRATEIDPAADPSTQVNPRGGVAETTTDLMIGQGPTLATGEPLTFALQDDSFLRVMNSDGAVAYTRLGALRTDAAGNITLPSGRFLEPPVVVPDGTHSPEIDPDGWISSVDASGARQNVGRITLARFLNPAALEFLGGGLYLETSRTGAAVEGSPGSDGFARVVPGALEGSNVEIAEEFTNMIVAQRAYQVASKTFSIGDEMLRIATNLTK